MKIAYYEENNYHTEILGTFLYYMLQNKLDITVYNDSDKSDYINYYKKLQNFNLKKINDLEIDHNKYDYIILGTSCSTTKMINYFKKIIKKIIPIHHLTKDIYKYNVPKRKSIVLTPLNIKNKKCNYILPIHNFKNINSKIVPKKNILSLIGRFKDSNRNVNDLIDLIIKYNSKNFGIHLYCRHEKFVPQKLFELSKLYPNTLKIYLKLNTKTIEKKLEQSKFLLTLADTNSCYHNDRLSGIIPLSFNFNIPLIIDKKLNNIYGFTSTLTYNNSITEIINLIINMKNNEYYDYIKKLNNDKINIINKNNYIISNIFKIKN